MKLTRVAQVMAVALMFQMLAVGVARAEDSTSQAKGAQKGAASMGDDEDLSLLDEDVKSLSSKEKLSRAAKKIKRMRTTLNNISELLQTVRDKERDILKINCINEKHAAIKGFLKVSEQSYIELKSAVDKGDGGSADHHYTLIAVAGQKVRSLAEEARLCTGEERRYGGKPKVKVSLPNDGDDHVDIPDDSSLTEDLPALTPYQ